MASTEGGVNIEEVAEETPEKIFKAEKPVFVRIFFCGLPTSF